MKATRRGLCFGAAAVLLAGSSWGAGAQKADTGDLHRADTEVSEPAGLHSAAWQGAESAVKDDLFTGTEKFAKNASDVTEVTMDPDTLDMVNGSGAKRAHNMILNVVRTYSYDRPGMYRMEDVEEFRRKLNTGDWHCSVHTRELKSGESTDICNRRRTDGLVESAIITVEPKELTFIHTIRKKSEGESSLGPENVWKLGLPNGWPPAATMAMMQPEPAIAMAEARAHADAGSALAIPQLDSGALQQQLREQMRNLDKSVPDAEGMTKLQQQLQGLGSSLQR